MVVKAKEEVIIEDGDKYAGKHVALDNLVNKKIFGSGGTPWAAIKVARKNGLENPMIVYVPEKNMVHLY